MKMTLKELYEFFMSLPKDSVYRKNADLYLEDEDESTND